MDALFYADNPGKNIVEGREGCVRVLRVTPAQITGIGGIIGIDAGVIALEHDIALSAFELGNDGVHSRSDIGLPAYPRSDQRRSGSHLRHALVVAHMVDRLALRSLLAGDGGADGVGMLSTQPSSIRA